jgi:colanic acid/amylovoran biosynthesis glycosyltransferase
VGLRFLVAADLLAAPMVVSFHGYDASRWPLQHGAPAYAPLFARAAGVTGNSQYMLGLLSSLGCPPDRLHLLRLGVWPERFPLHERRPRRDGRLRLLSVARLVEKKGLDDAIEALALLRAAGEDPHLEVVGEGPMRESLLERARRLGVADAVTLAGERDSDAVAARLRDADLFVLPSVTAADGDTEGTPVAIMEAMATGLAVVATRHAGIPEVVEDGVTGLLVPERDPRALAAAITSLARAPARRLAMGRAAADRVARLFGAGATIDALEEILRRAARPAAA